MILEKNSLKIQPLLRWAGGKKWLISRIKDFIPSNYNDYYEPFLGGASIFLNLTNKHNSYLSDINCELIEFYGQVKQNLPLLLKELKKYENSEDFFYKIRSKEPTDAIKKAARFFYLNRTCFNGIYRVNQQGKFNVPYGYREVTIIEKEKFVELQEKLKFANLDCHDFYLLLDSVKENDLVFLDPPYTVAHNNNGFIEYNQKIFSWEDQERLADFTAELIKKKVNFIMTNAYHNSIKKLYKNLGKHFELERHSTISGNKDSRTKISELIITNCL
jgi:DNA adenine methylase